MQIRQSVSDNFLDSRSPIGVEDMLRGNDEEYVRRIFTILLRKALF